VSFAELHCHSNFSFLDGASSPHELAARAAAVGMTALAVTDHDGLYGAVRFSVAAQEAGIRPIVGMEVLLRDAIAPDPHRIVVPVRRRQVQPTPTASVETPRLLGGGLPDRPRAARLRLPGHREAVREDLRGVREAERGPRLVLLARNDAGYRSLCRLASRGHLAGTKGAPRYDQALLAEHTEGLIALSACRHGEIGRRLLAGDREGARRAAEAYARLFADAGGSDGRAGGGSGTDASGSASFFLELQHHLLPDDDWLVAETVRLADETGIPVVVTNDAHYSAPEGRELQDVLVAIRHGLTLETSAHLRRPNGEYFLKGESALLALPPADPTSANERVVSAWREGIERAGEIAEGCSVDLGFEHYRFPGFDVPKGETPFSYLETLCHEGARRRYHPMTPPVVKQLAHELEVIERTGLAEFFLICWDLMKFAREKGIPAQGRGSAGDSIVAYVLGITRVDPIRHRLLFERFINEGRTTYPDIDIDFASSRREEVIQYVYERYGADHTGMVCNLVTYRARSAVREVGLALGFPPPLVDRVAKALETYDSVMVRRDLEAEGGFAHFFTPDHPDARPGGHADGPGTVRQGSAAIGPTSESVGFTDHMGRLQAPGRLGRLGRPDRPPGGGEREHSGGVAGIDAAAGLDLGVGLGHRADPGTQMGAPEPRSDRPAGFRHGHRNSDDKGGPGDSAASFARLRDDSPHSSVARVEPEPEPSPRGGSTVGLSPWERWLEMCARIAGFPRHLSIHVGGMLITAAPLIDIAPLERATMPGRVVVQFDKRDVEDLKLIKLDLLGLRMLSSIDEALKLIESDCGVHIDLDRLPEEIPAVFRMLQAADTVGVFQVESRAQMQTLPKSMPRTLDDLVVEVAIIRPGPIQGNAVHPYLRRRQGLEPVAYLHPSLAPVLEETLGVILYQEQVMEIAIRVAGFSAAGSDAFRRAMGTWRSSDEMEKLHARFVDGCMGVSGLDREQAEELYRQVAAFASFGFNKSHAAAFARTAYESAFLKLFYPAHLVVGLINAQPMGFYPVEVLVNDARRHGVAVLPVDVNHSRWRTTTEWIGMPGEALERPAVVDSPACVVATEAEAAGMAAPSAAGFAIRLGLHLVKGIGEEHEDLLDREFGAGPYRSLPDVVERTGLPEETIERMIRAGALDSLAEPRRRLLWQLREVMGTAQRQGRGARVVRRATRQMPMHLPATDAPELALPTDLERLADSYAVLSLDARRQVIELFRPALERLGAVRVGDLASRRPGRVRIGGLVVTRQHPMTAKGTVFLAVEDETGMANVTLWPDTWASMRGVVRRHALLFIDGTLQRESNVVNVVAREVRSLTEVSAPVGGPGEPRGVRHMGHAGMRRQ
jgi:error-prone DNA polymerase